MKRITVLALLIFCVSTSFSQDNWRRIRRIDTDTVRPYKTGDNVQMIGTFKINGQTMNGVDTTLTTYSRRGVDSVARLMQGRSTGNPDSLGGKRFTDYALYSPARASWGVFDTNKYPENYLFSHNQTGVLSGNRYNLRSIVNVVQPIAIDNSSYRVAGSLGQALIDTGNHGKLGTAAGNYGLVENYGHGYITYAIGNLSIVAHRGKDTIYAMSGFDHWSTVDSGGYAARNYNFIARSPLIAKGRIGYNYGLFIQNQANDSIGESHSIFQEGTASNVLNALTYVYNKSFANQFAFNGLDTAYVSASSPLIYSSAIKTLSPSYPFNDAGHLLLQSRSSGAARDVVIVGGLTPTVQAIFDGTNKSLTLGTTKGTGTDSLFAGVIKSAGGIRSLGAANGIGTYNPSRQFVISNQDSTGWEFRGKGSDAVGGVDVLAYNRATAAAVPMNFSASNFYFNSGSVYNQNSVFASKFYVWNGTTTTDTIPTKAEVRTIVSGGAWDTDSSVSLKANAGTATIGTGDSVRVWVNGLTVASGVANATYKRTGPAVADTVVHYDINTANYLTLYGKYGWSVGWAVIKK